jgi:DNA-binding NtrC family response regulator
MARIMVIDDEANWRDLCEASLSEDGHEIEAIADCSRALRRIKEAPPDLVLLDLRMPVSGRLMLGAIRAECPELPVVIHSNYSGYRDDPELRTAAGFVVKSTDLTALRDAVGMILGNGKARAPEL